jgi:hypothetical protein
MHGQSVLYRRPGDGGQGREGEDAARPLHQRVTARDEAITEVKVLQHFEYEVIHAVQSLTDKAFPAEITRRLNSSLGRHVSLAQVFVALERLEDKGYVISRESPPVRLYVVVAADAFSRLKRPVHRQSGKQRRPLVGCLR